MTRRPTKIRLVVLPRQTGVAVMKRAINIISNILALFGVLCVGALFGATCAALGIIIGKAI